MIMSIEQQEKQLTNLRERERSREIRETKEGEPNQELKAAAAMERADYLVKEVKQSKQQMQNIILHMQQVMATIKQLLAELQLTDDDLPQSVAQDQKRVELLQKRIATYREELIKMKEDLIKEYIETLKVQEPGLPQEELEEKARLAVEGIILGVEK